MGELEKFLEERSKIKIPPGDVAPIRLLAKELALGVHRGLWEPWVIVGHMLDGAKPMHSNSEAYFAERWTDYNLDTLLEVLIGHQYLMYKDDEPTPHLTPKAYDLLDDVERSNVFVSYKHSESSAFALLIVSTLNTMGLNAFCDMRLKPGDDWHPELKKQIEECEYFVVLIGGQTHKSIPTVREIQYAHDKKKPIISIWHNNRRHDKDKWKSHQFPNVADVIEKKHAIIVHNESAAGYNTAITELLTNRFGITP